MHPVLAYVVLLAMKPLPYIAGGLIVGWVFVSFDLYDNDYVALAVPTGMAVGFSLVFLPLTLALHRTAKRAVADSILQAGRCWLPTARGSWCWLAPSP